jgi:transposase-like protein
MFFDKSESFVQLLKDWLLNDFYTTTNRCSQGKYNLPTYLSTLFCLRCKSDHVIKNGKRYGLDVKQRYYCYNCRHMFYVPLNGTTVVKPTKRFSLRRETLRQIIHADIEEDKHRVVKEYSF